MIFSQGQTNICFQCRQILADQICKSCCTFLSKGFRPKRKSFKFHCIAFDKYTHIKVLQEYFLSADNNFSLHLFSAKITYTLILHSVGKPYMYT